MGFLHDMYAARGRAITEQQSVTVVRDKSPYYSPIDRTIVDGKSAHREHMKKHGVLEVGDMKLGEYGNADRAPMGSVRSDINRAIQELNR